MSETSRKPLVIIALDEPLASEVSARLSRDVYDVRLAQSPVRGKQYADASEADKLVQANEDRPGFVISDEATESSLSGAQLTSVASRKGWHTVLRTGSNKSNLRVMADYYLAGEFSGERNVEQIVKFIQDRTDGHGQVIPKAKLPEIVRWEAVLDEFINKEKAQYRVENSPPVDDKVKVARDKKIRAMVTTLADEIFKGRHPEHRGQMDDVSKERMFIERALRDIVHYVDKTDTRPSVLTTELLEHLDEAARKKTEAEKLDASFRENPQAAHERAVEQVRLRELKGDEPPGATEEFIRRIREQYPGFRMPGEAEEVATWQALERLRAEQRKKKRGIAGDVESKE